MLLMSFAFCGLSEKPRADVSPEPGTFAPGDTLPFEQGVFVSSSGDTLPYRLCLPLQYDSNKVYPLVLFFHGAGERGTDNALPLKHGPLAFARKSLQERHPCFVLVPQCPKNRRWVEVDWKLLRHEMPDTPSRPMRAALQLLERVQAGYSIDPGRLYVTGLSMGGFGTWDLVTRYPERFAAAVPVCGGGDERLAARLAKLPIWAFHGLEDMVVRAERSQNMIKAIRLAGGSPKFTEYPKVGHNAWDFAYGDEAMFEWLFAQYAE